MTDERIESPDTKRPERVPPGQRKTRRFPVLHEGRIPDLGAGNWRLRIWGLVSEDLELDFEEFSALPFVEVHSDIHCVTGWSNLDNLWRGVPSSAIRDSVDIAPEAGFVMVHAPGYSANLSVEDFFQEDVLLATEMNGRPLPAKHGGPVRLVVPRLYFWKSVKWVTGLEFVREERPGFWESRGYHIRGDPWKEERYSR